MEKETSSATVEVRFQCTPEVLQVMQRVQALSESPDLATALVYAVYKLQQEYDFRIKGYQIMAVPRRCSVLKGGHDGSHYVLELNGMPKYS